ncbi:hypothetical protein GCM10007049_35860 [Echinicola pacifica]|uniref:Uncharacterized protein n=2 Tax=Echinicola pacifica TaxID=346377 RepID=A0A918QAP3_9BACT|nr:hypothetical protein GCM10007049_35860 [Echinicola pacifica]
MPKKLALPSSKSFIRFLASIELPNFENPSDIAKYVGYKVLDGASAGGAGSLSRGVVNFAQSGFKFGSVVTGSNSALQLIDKSAGLAGGVEDERSSG